MTRNNPWKDTCISYSKAVNTIDPQLRVDDTPIRLRGHAARGSWVIYRLDAVAHERLKLGICVQVALVVQIRAREGVVKQRRERLRARDFQTEFDTAYKLS
jgi:hypothetical protein